MAKMDVLHRTGTQRTLLLSQMSSAHISMEEHQIEGQNVVNKKLKKQFKDLESKFLTRLAQTSVWLGSSSYFLIFRRQFKFQNLQTSRQ